MAIANPSNYSVPATNAANDTPDIQWSKPPATQPYILFTPKARMSIVIIVGFATIISPLTATTQFETSRQAIDITLTIYISFQAISPAIFGPLSDSVGRRPTNLLTLAIYALANLGMALNKSNYGVLLLLRALQSLGASAAFAMSYGIVSDVCVPSERGRMMGWVSMASNLGTCVGPIIAGLVVYLSGDIEWVFWAIFIVGILLFFVVGILLPETGRNIVGNGSDRTKIKAWHRSWWSYITTVGFLLDKKNDTREEKPAGNTEQSPSGRARRNIFAQLNIRMFLVPLRIIFFPDAFCCLWIHGSFYAVDYILAATVSDIFMHTYHFNTDARRHNHPIDRVHGDDLREFPIELARSRGIYYLLLFSTSTLIAYGWTARNEKHFSILLILQLIQGFWDTCFYTIYNTLLVDIFPQNPSTAAASASITRCAMAAIGVTSLQPLMDAAGLGWYFTALGIMSAVCGAAAVWCIRGYGMRWRSQRNTNL
ncbi:major facilitator superfamily domain-containing protein [Aspergillus welwitschiae]|uniref:Major facilitator superfamily domain-containing protein n=1 Tax=Aspergillus welwitschiae TaxID=1341132 RepID=A0A3F3Q2M3_9EURO|nr:major facilitator superfamily domain-containing protein [Aspergillus welwitschiae]RDH32926.1 major facilitator superfamily domain-containing protein [Aspergillus welwitschiae]